MPIYKNGDKGYRVQINYKAPDGSYRQLVRCNKYTRTKSDAKKYELELLASVRDGVHVESLTFEELFYKFKEEKKNDLKKNSLSYYDLVIPRYVFPMFRRARVDSINKEKIIKWKAWLQNEHAFSLKYKNNIFTCFSAILNYAVNLYDLPFNPMTKVGKFKAPELVHDETIHFWTADEFSIFISSVKEHLDSQNRDIDRVRWSALYTAYSVLFWAGLRRSEALALNWCDIVSINGVRFLNVYKSINQRLTPYEITTTKNRSSIRKVPICDELDIILKTHHDLCQSLCYGFDDSSFFVCGSMDPIAKNTLGLVMSRVAAASGLEHIRIHDLRHSYCSLLINGGFPLSTIAHLMGHANTNITQKVYSHIYPDANLQVIEFMNALNRK